ncbi:sensor histidine kinase [Sunxiuqinia elliptica]|uniref:Histidine kinase n=1 Tax=Sunxiuqinia elliptica TaxID=655355 RepID=A0A1I2CVE3_9BACT|nr:histidine kinase [Sunxiuqinia elliptica]SFE71690.1 Histidine kinase [Sunxiuqinia elliptica]
MKTARKISLSLFFFLLFIASQAQEKLQLKLKEGQTLLFNCTIREFEDEINKSKTNQNHLLFELEKQYEIELAVGKQINENQLAINMQLKRFIANYYTNKKPAIHFDSMFPPSDELDQTYFPKIICDVLQDLTIKMKLDLTNNTLKFIDNSFMDKTILELLKQKIFQDEEIATQKESIDSLWINPLKSIVEDYLLRFNNAAISSKDSALINQKDYLIDLTNDYIKISKHRPYKKDHQIHEYEASLKINRKNGLITESVFRSYVPVLFPNSQHILGTKIEEKSFRLIKNSSDYSPQANISGFIEHPQRKALFFKVLNAPFGVKYDIHKATLDENNHFAIDIPLTRNSFIFLSYIEDTARIMNTTFKVIYAEPGDSIKFDLLGEAENSSYQFRHNRALENTFLTQNFDSILNVNASHQGIIMPFILEFQQNKKTTIPHALTRFIFSEELVDDDFPEGVSAHFRNYLTHETEMLKISLACGILNFYRYINNTNIHTPDDKELIQQLNERIAQVNPSEHYEEYGYFSRNGVSAFAGNKFYDNFRFTYHISEQKQLPSGYPKGISTSADILQQSSFLNLPLAGSALIREKALLIRSSPHFNQKNTPHLISKYKKVLDEIISVSNDTLLNRKTTENFKSTKQLLSGEIFKKQIFLTASGDTVSMQKFLGKKACVICFTSSENYSYPQYRLDQITDKYSDLKAIIINDGKLGWDVWKEQTKTRNSTATHLFYFDQKTKLSQLFSVYPSNYFLMVFDRNGDLVEYAADPYQIDHYIEKALEQPLKQKEPSKSTLFGIIWFMGGTMLLALVAFLIFKARMRTKLRKQKQEKRLQELQLSAIRAQMNPHFLFNSLNSVQNLIQKNQGREAHLYLSDFAGLIRKVLKNSQQEELSLAEELETLNQYIKLEQLRFNFEFEQVVDESIDQNHFMVPSLILQPLAENAILHGLQHLQGVRKLKVEVKNLGTMIQINMEDNGIGLKKSSQIKSNSNGIGLNLNEERLKLMAEKYGGQYTFRLVDLSQENRQGTRVEITIPEEL